MPDLPDYELLRTEELAAVERRRVNPAVWIAAVLFLVAAAVAVYVVYGRRSTPAASVQSPPVARTESPAKPLGGQAEAISVPPLGESDPVVRELVRRITSHPAALSWLATNGLIRNFTVVVANVVEGITPSAHLKALRPATAFQTVERNGQLFIDSRSYERYNSIAAAVASIDPAGAARVYATLKPRVEEAYAELGARPAAFDRALEQAIVALLQVPAIDGPIRVEPKGIGYRFADPALERLSGAQKHLLRTGPRNVRMIQSALRQLALALGIPSERLP
jgi:hypothetical protein